MTEKVLCTFVIPLQKIKILLQVVFKWSLVFFFINYNNIYKILSTCKKCIIINLIRLYELINLN